MKNNIDCICCKSEECICICNQESNGNKLLEAVENLRKEFSEDEQHLLDDKEHDPNRVDIVKIRQLFDNIWHDHNEKNYDRIRKWLVELKPLLFGYNNDSSM